MTTTIVSSIPFSEFQHDDKENQIPETRQIFGHLASSCNDEPTTVNSNFSPGSPRRDNVKFSKPARTCRSSFVSSQNQQQSAKNVSGPNSVACVDVTKMNRTELEAWCQSLSARLIECSLDVDEWKSKVRTITEQGKELYNMYVMRCRQLQRLSTQLQQLRKNSVVDDPPHENGKSGSAKEKDTEWAEKYRTLSIQFDAVTQECQNAKNQLLRVQQEHEREIRALQSQLEMYRMSARNSSQSVKDSSSSTALSSSNSQPNSHNNTDEYKKRYRTVLQDKQTIEQHISRTHTLTKRNLTLFTLFRQYHNQLTSAVQQLQCKSAHLHNMHHRLSTSLHHFTSLLSRLIPVLPQLVSSFHIQQQQQQQQLLVALKSQLQQRTSEVSTLQQQLETLTAEVEVLRTHCTDLHSEIITEHTLRTVLEEQLQHTQHTLDNLQREHTNLQQEVVSLQSLLQNYQQQLHDLTSHKIHLEETVSTLEKERNSERSQRVELEERLRVCSDDVQQLNTQLKNLTESHQSLTQTLSTTQRALQTLTERYQQLEIENLTLTRNIAFEQHQMKMLQHQHDKTLITQHTLENELTRSGWALSISHGQNIVAEAQLHLQESHSHTLQSDLIATRSELQRVQCDFDALHSQFLSTQENFTQSQRSLASAHERIALLTSELDSLTQQYNSLSVKYHELQTRHRAALQENTLLTDQLSRLHGVQYQFEHVQREFEMSQLKCTAREKELDTLRASHTTLQNEFSTLKTQNITLQKDRDTLEVQLHAVQSDLSSLQQWKQQTVEHITQLEARIANLTAEVQTRDTKLNDLSQVLTLKETALQENTTRFETINNQLRELQTRYSNLVSEHEELTRTHLSEQTQIQLLTTTKNDLAHTVNVLEQQIKQVEEVWQTRIVNLQHHLHSRSAQDRARLEEYKLIASHRQEELSLLHTQYRTLLHKNKLLHSMCNTLLLQLDYTYRALTKTLFTALKKDTQNSTTEEGHPTHNNTTNNNNNNNNKHNLQQTSLHEDTKPTTAQMMVTVLKKATTWLAQRRQLLELSHNFKNAQNEIEHLRNELEKQQRKALEMEDHYEELLRTVRLELWKAKEQWDTTDEYCRMFSSLFRQIQTILQQEQQNDSNGQQPSQTQQLVQKLLRLINYHFTDIQT